MGKDNKPYEKHLLDHALELRKQGLAFDEIEAITTVSKSKQGQIYRQNNILLTPEQLRVQILKKKAAKRAINPTIIDGKKSCSRCKQWLNLEKFSICRQSKDGLNYSCIDCQSLHYQLNAQKICARVRARKASFTPEQKEIFDQKAKEYYQSKAVHIKNNVKKWQSKNDNKVREYSSKSQKKHQSRKNAATSLYRAIKKTAQPAKLSFDEKQAITEFYKKCPEGYHVDHIVPLQNDLVCGLHVLANLQYLPGPINEEKGERNELLPEEVSNIGKCFQKIRREQTKEEDITSGLFIENIAPKDFVLSSELLSIEHTKFIERYEWLGNTGFNVKWVFCARYQGRLGGVVLMAEPTSYSTFGHDKEVLIQRGACASWAPRNLNSQLVMYGCRWMVYNTSKRLFVAYSDPDAGEIGTIYQACNFKYLGHFYGSKVLYTLPSGKKVSSRYFTRTSSMRRWAKILGIEWQKEWYKPNGFQDISVIPKDILLQLKQYASDRRLECPFEKQNPKAKYALLLTKNRNERKEFENSKFSIGLPYPKRKLTQS